MVVAVALVGLRNPDSALVLAFGLMLAYEVVLSEFGLANYIFYAPRYDFVSANREGLASLVGYLSLQLMGIGIGNFMYKQLLSKAELKALMSGKPS